MISAPQLLETQYGEHCWGITASHGPGDIVCKVSGVERHFRGYVARGVPFGPDDGTIAPEAAAACLPFAPDVVLPTSPLGRMGTVQEIANLVTVLGSDVGSYVEAPTVCRRRHDGISRICPWWLSAEQQTSCRALPVYCKS